MSTGYDVDEVSFLCKNGKSYNASDHCLYDTDAFGIMKPCRDATHLQNCGKSCKKLVGNADIMSHGLSTCLMLYDDTEIISDYGALLNIFHEGVDCCVISHGQRPKAQ